MEELGEDPRGRGGGAAGALGGVLPRGPLSVVSTLATGVVALGTQALVWAGDAGDRLLFNTPLGASPSCDASLVRVQHPCQDQPARVPRMTAKCLRRSAP